MYKLLPGRKDSDDSSIGYHRDITIGERESIENKTTKQIYHVRTCFKEYFGFAGHQEKATFGWGKKLTVQRNSDNQVLSHRAGTEATNLFLVRRVVRQDIGWYVPLHAPKKTEPEKNITNFESRATTELSCIKTSS